VCSSDLKSSSARPDDFWVNESRVSSLESGVWSLESGVWGLQSGVWGLQSGVWSRDSGTARMHRDSLPNTFLVDERQSIESSEWSRIALAGRAWNRATLALGGTAHDGCVAIHSHGSVRGYKPGILEAPGC